MKEKGENEENDPDWSPSKAPYQNQLNTVLNKGDNPQDTKILSFNNKCPAATGIVLKSKHSVIVYDEKVLPFKDLLLFENTSRFEFM